MQAERISSVNFGIRPKLNVSSKNRKLLNEVADRFDVLNKKLDKTVSPKIRKNTNYYIVENCNELSFVQGGFCEHSITFLKTFIKEPAETIAETLAKAAEIFSADDKLFAKTCKYINSISRKYPEIDKDSSFENEIWNTYMDYIAPVVRNEFKDNHLFLQAKNINM